MVTTAQKGVPPLAQEPERRADERQKLVLRVGVLTDDRRTSFCLVKNVSPQGVEVKFYTPLKLDSEVRLTVGDEDLVTGQVAWIRGPVAGIAFKLPLDPDRLLRAIPKAANSKRRSSPRVNVAARAILRTTGQMYSGELFDISTLGAKVRTSRPLSEGRCVSLVLPEMPAILAFVRWSEDRLAGLVFQAPVPIQMLAPWLATRIRVSASAPQPPGPISVEAAGAP